MAEDERPDEEGQPSEPQPTEEPAAEAPAPDEQPAAEETAPEEPAAAEETAAPDEPAEEPAPEQPAAEEAPATEEAPAAEPTGEAEAVAPEPTATGAEGADAPGGDKPDVVPGAHLEPDLVLDQSAAGEDDDFARYAGDGEGGEGESAASVEETPAVPVSTIDLAAGARYKATGKRKTAIARVIVKPGSGSYQINGRTLEEFFPRQTLQRNARQPLETVGYDTRMDVVARIQGGGVSSQADALRHGISRALVEADPNLRTELKRRGFLTRDAREKERKKAGLKKARKRPQFSKR